MKLKLKLSVCLLLSMFFISTIQSIDMQEIDPHTVETATTKEESSWSKMMARIMALFSQKKTSVKKEANVIKTAKDIKKPVRVLSREQATEGIRKVTSKLFDPNDVNHITLHLSQMKEFAKFLDDVEDKKLIAAIHFLLMNHHRSSILDLAFWLKAVKELEIDIVIPMTPEIANLPKPEKLALLRKKMTIGN